MFRLQSILLVPIVISFLLSLLDTGFIVVGERIHHDMIFTNRRQQHKRCRCLLSSGDSMLPNDACRPCSAFLVTSALVATQWENDISIEINYQAQVVSS
jgi:hypothetical protein